MYRKRVSRLRKKLQSAKAQIARLSGKSNDIKRAKNILAQHLVGNAYNMMVAQLTMLAKCNKKRWSKGMYCKSCTVSPCITRVSAPTDSYRKHLLCHLSELFKEYSKILIWTVELISFVYSSQKESYENE